MRRTVALAAVATMLATGPAIALQPCIGVSNQGQKLLVDDITGVQSLLLDILEQRVDAALAKLQLESRSSAVHPGPADASTVRVRALRCNDRRPDGRSTFNDALVRELNNYEVVLEVWAKTEVVPTEGGGGHRAIVGYAIIPVRHYSPNAAYGVVLIDRVVRSVDSADELLALLDQSGKLSAYATAGSGLRLLNAAAYDQARSQLCLARAKLERMQDRSTYDDELLDYVRDLSEVVASRAKADPTYKGTLRAADPGKCKLGPL